MNRQFLYLEKINASKIDADYIALDLETTGLNPRKDRIVGASFCTRSGIGYYTPDVSTLLDLIEDSYAKVIFHNAVFDFSFIKQAGFPFEYHVKNGLFHDTMILADVINPDRPSLSLKELSVELVGEESIKSAIDMWRWLVATYGGRSETDSLTWQQLSSFAESHKDKIVTAPKQILAPYAAEDAINTYEIFLSLCDKVQVIGKHLTKWGVRKNPRHYYLEEQAQLIPIVTDMQMGGVKLDLEETAKKQSELEKRMRNLGQELTVTNAEIVSKCEEDLHQRRIAERLKKNKTGKLKRQPARIEFNWDSNDHLKLLFLQHFKLPVNKKTLKGNASIDRSFLEGIKSQYPWVEKLLEYKKLKKLMSTYLNNLLSKQEGGVIHANFHLTGTATGRFSSSNPNLQNLPKHGGIKSLFVPQPGRKFIYADYSQLELRVAAHVSGDSTLISAYTAGLDLHQQTADLIGTTRDKGKTINFAIIYNASGWRIAEIMGWMEGVPLCVQEVRNYKCVCDGCRRRKAAAKKGEEIIQTLFGKYTGLKAYVDKQKEFMTRYRVTISQFGRIRRLDDLKSEVRSEYNHAIKAGFNLPIQSFGASLCKRSMVSLFHQGYRIVNQIHDSILVEISEGEVNEALARIKATMENIATLKVPLLVEPKVLCCFEDKTCKMCGQITCSHREHICKLKEEVHVIAA